MTNLYDLLTRLLTQVHENAAEPPNRFPATVQLSQEDVQFITQFVSVPDAILEFKAKRVGGTDDEPLMAQDYRIAGQPVDIFCLITEAMLANPYVAELIIQARNFYLNHVPTCEKCRNDAIEASNNLSCGDFNWTFLPHKPI